MFSFGISKSNKYSGAIKIQIMGVTSNIQMIMDIIILVN